MKKITRILSNLILLTLVLGLTGCKPAADTGSENPGCLDGAGKITKENIIIENTTYQKTSEVDIIPVGNVAVIDMKDDSSWDTYTDEKGFCDEDFKGVFIKNRKVTLSPFAMGQYEVTQELYTAIMGINPSEFNSDVATGETQSLRPVENVTHYDAITFCNELTKKTMTEEDYVYFSDEAKTKVYTKEDATNKKRPYLDITKKGYRLPTEAEWEYAARGGNPQSASWKNAFGKVSITNNKINDSTKRGYACYLEYDDKLLPIGWYKKNSQNKTHEVGLKEKNNLNIYDMPGNVAEWCCDGYEYNIETGEISNPVGEFSSYYISIRGGNWFSYAYGCAVSCREKKNPKEKERYLGFRICRSIF